ncbi:PKD domain-containing protein [Glaciecola sp. 1036]|uniref:PKD domain-containing protein n=1 Tax=Alteromonadaceae TaxID=72275 RepID=UPI003D07A260
MDFKPFVLFAVVSLLAACGGGGGKSSGETITPRANTPPSVNAGTDASFDENSTVTISATASDSDGSIVSYAWTQISGFSINISNANTASLQFNAPDVTGNLTLEFRITVTDNDGSSSSDTIVITIVDLNPNSPPVAQDIVFTSDLSSPYINVTLLATDADNDTLNYILESEFDGEGYEQAFISDQKLFITMENSSVEEVKLYYRVTDGIAFSETASVTIIKEETTDSGTGAEETSSEDYAGLPNALGGNYLHTGPENTLPTFVDLSPLFPLPGNQGQQESCVGWALGYAIKSYQERIDNNWEYTEETTFSPAWIYNQINNGVDNGSNTFNALNLLQTRGAASLLRMPYDQNDFTTQPSGAAIAEAVHYKIDTYARVDINQARQALANYFPVYFTISVYDTFDALYNSGENAVYNSISNNRRGYHAVAVVGYDDNKFGGAFKIMNSWGQQWGDKGFAWIPYDMVASVVSSALVVLDENSDPNNDLQIEIPIQTERPNLLIKNWDIELDEVRDNPSFLYYEATNDGGIATSSNDHFVISLYMSNDQNFNLNDRVLSYDYIEQPINPGASLVRSRDDQNAAYVYFPEFVETGDYYLAMVIDPFNQIEEIYEQDNVTASEQSIYLENSPQVDFAIDNWLVEWIEDGDGTATLEYSISNIGQAPNQSAWFTVEVYLHTNPTPDLLFHGTDGAYRVHSEAVEVSLAPGEQVVRDETNATTFNIAMDHWAGTPERVPSGTYYVSLQINYGWDDEPTSGLANNISTAYNRVGISSLFVYSTGTNNDKSQASKTTNKGSVYNGKQIDTQRILTKKISIKNIDGIPRIVAVEDIPSTQRHSKSRSIETTNVKIRKSPSLPRKVLKSGINGRIAPVNQRIALPKQTR